MGLAASSNGDIDGVGRNAAGDVLLSLLGNLTVPGVSSNDEDVLAFSPAQLGNTTTGSYSMFSDLSTKGISTAANAGSLCFVD